MSEATCSQPATCKNGCGLIEGDILGHTYGDWEIVKEGTHYEEGIKAKVCTECGHTIEESFKLNGNDSKYGCNASVGGSGLGLLLTALSGFVFVRKRKIDNKRD